MKFKHKSTGAVITCIRWTGTDQSYGYIHNRLKKIGIECSDNFGSIVIKGNAKEKTTDLIVPTDSWIWFSNVDGKPVRSYTNAEINQKFEPLK